VFDVSSFKINAKGTALLISRETGAISKVSRTLPEDMW
jgi:hypothetical protein